MAAHSETMELPDGRVLSRSELGAESSDNVLVHDHGPEARDWRRAFPDRPASASWSLLPDVSCEPRVGRDDRSVIELVVREFTADVALQSAWDHLAQVERWTSWARHIKRVSLEPPGPLTDASEGTFRLAGGARSTFRMEIYDPPKRWQWVGRFLTTQVHYDHRFEPVDSDHTRLIWTVAAEGPGSATLGRVFGTIYARNLDKAIPNLQAELRPSA